MISRRQLLRYGAAAGSSLLLPRHALAQAASGAIGSMAIGVGAIGTPGGGGSAAVFNIHYNLIAWASGTYALGQRLSSAGNAYQCTIGGTSTAAPTGTGADIDNGGTAHFKFLSVIDFTDLQSWANAMPATQSQNYIVQLWNNGVITIPDVTHQFLVYSATAGSFTTLITPAPGEGMIGNRSSPLAYGQPAGVTFQAPSTGTAATAYFFLQTANTTLSGIQFVDSNPTANLAVQFALDGCTLYGCILDGKWLTYTGVNNARVVNNLLICRATGALPNGAHPIKWDTASTGAVLAGNTIWGGNGVPDLACLLNSTPATGIARNNILVGCPTPLLSQNVAGAWVVDHCLTDQSSINGTTSFTNTDAGGNIVGVPIGNIFINSTTNYRLAPGSPAINAGATDLTFNPSATDIFGVSRPQQTAWDMGAQEAARPNNGNLLLTGVG